MKALYYENDTKSLSLFPFPIASLEGKTFSQHHLFHEPNCVASNYNVARVLTQNLKLDYENIHPCAKSVSCFKGIIMMMSAIQNVEVFNTRML
jgi:hypothetical protein